MDTESTPTSLPVASLVGTTDEGIDAMGGQAEVRIASFPFRIGRESRMVPSTHLASEDLRLNAAPQLNDLYLRDPSRKRLQISREHFAIEYAGGKFFLLDRGSSCGTIVAERRVGGDRAGGQTELRSGDRIGAGNDSSPCVFRFEIATD